VLDGLPAVHVVNAQSDRATRRCAFVGYAATIRGYRGMSALMPPVWLTRASRAPPPKNCRAALPAREGAFVLKYFLIHRTKIARG